MEAGPFHFSSSSGTPSGRAALLPFEENIAAVVSSKEKGILVSMTDT